jgi:Tat protein secretion system quality control protein TatD with DNase activity
MYSATFGGRAGRSKKSGPKSKKVKCGLCGAKGHDGEACPKKGELAHTVTSSVGGAGSGITHKTSRKAKKAVLDDEPQQLTDYGLALSNDNDNLNDNDSINPNNINPYVVFDAGCDVGASMETLAILFKASEKKCIATYLAAIQSPLYGGAICRQYIKASKHWSTQAPRVISMKEADPHLFFVIGLGPGFLEHIYGHDNDDDNSHDNGNSNDDEMDEAVDVLVDAMEDDERVVGFCAKLDYTADTIVRIGIDTQLRRLQATCKAAQQVGVPIQIRLGNSDMNQDDNEQQQELMRDLAKALLAMQPNGEAITDTDSNNNNNNLLQVHLSSWNGTSEHMRMLLKAFPDTLYIGMNASVGFAKATTAHECAFDVPLDRLLLETDNVIPAPVTKSLGRKAFSHSGLIPYCAAAIAEHKKMRPMDVARAASENTVRLYGKGIAERAQQAMADAVERNAKQKEVNDQIAIDNDNDKNGEVIETKQDEKKKKKKSKASKDNCVKHDDTEECFDDDILSSFLSK